MGYLSSFNMPCNRKLQFLEFQSSEENTSEMGHISKHVDLRTTESLN